MKLHLPAFTALLLLSASLKAQEPAIVLEQLPPQSTASAHQQAAKEDAPESLRERKWRFGATAGYFHSTVDWVATGTDIGYAAKDHVRSHPGFTAGFAASYPFGEVWSFDTGLNLSMWGFGYKESGLSLRSDRYVLEIPVMITFFESAAYIPVFIQAGVLGGVTLGGVNKITVPHSADPWNSPAARDSFTKFSFGIVVGIGYGHFTFQFINNFTSVWSRSMARSWEEYTRQTIAIQTPRAYSLTYTYWF